MFYLILNTKSFLKNRTKNTCPEFMWKSSATGPLPFVVIQHVAFPLTRKAASLFLSYFITMYLVWRIRNSMPSWHPGERKLHCLSWCARSSPLRTGRSGLVCESEECRPSLTEERVLSGWKKRETNENSKRNNAKGQKKRLSRGLRKCIRIREGPLYTCFTNIFSRFSCFERLLRPIVMEDLYVSKSFFNDKSVVWLRRPWFHLVFHLVKLNSIFPSTLVVTIWIGSSRCVNLSWKVDSSLFLMEVTKISMDVPVTIRASAFL